MELTIYIFLIIQSNLWSPFEMKKSESMSSGFGCHDFSIRSNTFTHKAGVEQRMIQQPLSVGLVSILTTELRGSLGNTYET